MLAALLAVGWVVCSPSTAMADSRETFANTAPVELPDASGDSTTQSRTTIEVTGLSGAIDKVTVKLRGLTHPDLGRLAVMVVAPSGQNLVLLSGIDGPARTTRAAIVFADSADAHVPTRDVPSGRFRPTSAGAPSSFAAPAPEPSSESTLAGAFRGIEPNGDWTLYLADGSGGSGQLAGGWSLTITTTTTKATYHHHPRLVGRHVGGEPATFVATVQAGAEHVTRGSVRLIVDGRPAGDPVRLGYSGEAVLAAGNLAEGTHDIEAIYSGSGGYLGSKLEVTRHIANATVVEGRSSVNAGPGRPAGRSGSSAIPRPLTSQGSRAWSAGSRSGCAGCRCQHRWTSA